jgi:hypothetical protein
MEAAKRNTVSRFILESSESGYLELKSIRQLVQTKSKDERDDSLHSFFIFGVEEQR